MNKLSDSSVEKLKTCNVQLQRIVTRALELSPIDFIILCGYRGEEEQTKAFDEGKSKLKYPQSAHNRMPSLAIDIAPYPIDWKDTKRFDIVSCAIKIAAYEENVKIIWGGDWIKFKDYPHYELM